MNAYPQYSTRTQPIPHEIDPLTLYNQLTEKSSYRFIFESAEYDLRKGRYTFIGFDPLAVFVAAAGTPSNIFTDLKKRIADLRSAHPDGPGLFGYLSFEAARFTENVEIQNFSDIPDAVFFMPQHVLTFDHTNKTLTVFSTDSRMHEKVFSLLGKLPASHPNHNNAKNISAQTIPLGTQEVFFKAVEKAKSYITAGDLMQLVLSQKLTIPTPRTSQEIYAALKKSGPAPYMYLLEFPDFSIIGSSPETLAKVSGNVLTTRPIAGTRRRGKTSEEDLRLSEELMHDPKERAEHVMLVDLGRNDVGKVCTPGSIQVTRSFELEKFSTVMHIVSEVKGTLAPEHDSVDALCACFPAGTLSGAPKRRALERIIEIEKAPRGIYGGAVGYFDLAGSMDFAIAIRTMVHRDSQLYLQAGAGIVADSTAPTEDLECRNKMKAPYTAAVAH